LIRLIDNLLSNAIKYTPYNGSIDVKLSKILQITNDGELDNNIQITKKFIRANKNEGGFGIGLDIVQKISNYYKYKFSIISINSKVIVKVIYN